MQNFRMGNTFGREKGMLLPEVLENLGNIDATKGIRKKRLVTLCQGDWPLLTREGTPAER